MREHPELIDDEDCLNEMLTFARNSKGRPEAVEGAHDDCVMALAITYYVRQQQRATVETRHKRVKWDKDQWEDYRSADATERAYLISKWGNPF
jgi:phage terminase large subunit